VKPLSKVKDAQDILKALGLPPGQQNEISALTLIALCGVKEEVPWELATRKPLTISKGIMSFISDSYGKHYAPNTRETFRREVLHYFVLAGVADHNPFEPNLPINSPRNNYAISESALEAIKCFGTDRWQEALEDFISEKGNLAVEFQKRRKKVMVPIVLPTGKEFHLSPGKHNVLESEIINSFAPRFAPGAQLLYLGDTANKSLYIDTEALGKLGIYLDDHTKLPDIILLQPQKDWLFLIEAVTSHGPMNPKRVKELKEIIADSQAKPIFVTAFLDIKTFKKYASDIAWETEVWITERPDHLIHFNGDRFLGPR